MPGGARSAACSSTKAAPARERDKCVDVFAVFEKADVVRAGGLERRHIGDSAAAVRPRAAAARRSAPPARRAYKVRPDRKSADPPSARSVGPAAPPYFFFGLAALALAAAAARLRRGAAAAAGATKLTVSVGICSSSFCSTSSVTSKLWSKSTSSAALEHHVGLSLLGDVGDDLQHLLLDLSRAPRHSISRAPGACPAHCGRDR